MAVLTIVISETRLVARFPCNSAGFSAGSTLSSEDPEPPRKASNLSPEPSPKGGVLVVDEDNRRAFAGDRSFGRWRIRNAGSRCARSAFWSALVLVSFQSSAARRSRIGPVSLGRGPAPRALARRPPDPYCCRALRVRLARRRRGRVSWRRAGPLARSRRAIASAVYAAEFVLGSE
jgi:hypothetical protein